MFKTRILLLIFFLLVSFTWLFSSGLVEKVKASKPNRSNHTLTTTSAKKLQLRASEARAFAQQKGYNDIICFLIDMSLHSGQNRFFVYDLKRDTIRNSGLVTHGRCNQYWLEGRKYGNTVGCGCTSLGKYKIGNTYNGRFGLAYKLYGLDKTNDKAFQRFVVLHAHDCVPESEVKEDICQSDGCPTVSINYLQYLKPIIDASRKPVLLWIYN
ncbi:murein L,D-transpeptidase catalytic domain-containing protein [Terrimonas alba]|uniref:murein L,D-transpeptidase catalytic domain-containing protein n=1 Tax=Terrimonas alba TaxID=3349636 RepID=UPI0035F34E20